METNETRPPSHRLNTIKSALHIMEQSNADSLEKINAALLCLYPEDLASLEKTLKQTLNTLNQKI